MKEFLDKLSGKEVLDFLNLCYGHNEPVWEECSNQEYERYAKKDILEQLLSEEQYKAVPIYKDWKGGCLNLIKLQNVIKPDYYKYYKLVGYKRVIYLNSELIDYCNKRHLKYEKAQKIRY